MQKIDFIKNLEDIVYRLQSQNIVNLFETGFSKQGNQEYQYNLITPLLFVSKSNYDQILQNETNVEILNTLNAKTIYNEDNLSILTNVLRITVPSQIINQPSALLLYNFHKTLVTTLKLSKKVLVSEILSLDFQSSLDQGIIIFQILIEGDGLDTEKYIKILEALQELIEALSKIHCETNLKSEIILLDSGSDTNVGVKTNVETAKSLFLIFKEVWDFITNFRYYKQNQNNKALLDSLSIREELKKKCDEGIISSEEMQEYIFMIKTRTDNLIGMKVLPKQIVMENIQVNNKKLLNEFEGLKMLTGGE